MSSKSQLLKNKIRTGSITLFLGRLTGSLLAELVIILLAWSLSPSELGQFFFVISMASMFAILVRFGMDKTVVYMIGKTDKQSGQAEINSIASLVVVLTIVMSAFLMPVYWVLSPSILLKVIDINAIDNGRQLFCVLVFVVAVIGTIQEIFRGKGEILSSIFYGELAPKLLFLFLMGFVVLIDSDSLSFDYVISVYVISFGFALLVAVYFLGVYRSHNYKLWPYQIREIIVKSIPLLGSGIAIFILAQSSLWIVGYYLPESDVALYGTALRLAGLIILPLMIVNGVYMPIVSELYFKNDLRKMEVMLRTAALVVSLPSICIIGFYMILGDSLLSWLYGPFYMDSWGILMILSIGFVITSLTGSCGIVLMMTKCQYDMLWITLLSGVFSILLALILIRQHGVVGAAVATSAGMVMQNLLATLFVKIRIGVWTLPIINYSAVKNTVLEVVR